MITDQTWIYVNRGLMVRLGLLNFCFMVITADLSHFWPRNLWRILPVKSISYKTHKGELDLWIKQTECSIWRVHPRAGIYSKIKSLLSTICEERYRIKFEKPQNPNGPCFQREKRRKSVKVWFRSKTEKLVTSDDNRCIFNSAESFIKTSLQKILQPKNERNEIRTNSVSLCGINYISI